MYIDLASCLCSRLREVDVVNLLVNVCPEDYDYFCYYQTALRFINYRNKIVLFYCYASLYKNFHKNVI